MMRKLTSIFFFILACNIHAQLNLHPTTPKEKRLLKNRVLNNTDHGYFGIDGGIALDFSTISAVESNDESAVDNNFTGSFNEEFILFQNFRVFGGYKWRSHYFELAYASYHTNGRIKNSVDAENNYYGAIQLCYYYQLPIKSTFINLLIGPEIGWAFRVKGAGESGSGYYINGFYYPSPYFRSKSPQLNDNIKNIVGGVSVQSDFKLRRNFTLFTKINVTYIHIFNDKYIYAVPGGPPGSQPPYFDPKTNWNLNLSFGLKFDFFSKKKKQQTFDQLGIEDPYKK